MKQHRNPRASVSKRPTPDNRAPALTARAIAVRAVTP
jgi:hypothetical protein